MRRVLLLNLFQNNAGKTTGFPKKFDIVQKSVSASGVPLFLSRNTVENAVLSCINNFNHTINVEAIEYTPLLDQFPFAYVGSCTGLIVEEKLEPETGSAPSTKEYVFMKEGHKYSRSIFAYVFVSPPNVESRNSFVAQTVFPELLDYMERYLPSPSYSIANKPIFFINIAYGPISPLSILRHFVGMESMGINYLEAFGPSFNPIKDAPINVQDFVQHYYSGNTAVGIYDWFKIDFTAKTFEILTDKFNVGDYLEQKKDGFVGFHGSSEKFFIINMLPVAIMAHNEGYKINLKAFGEFCSNNGVLKFSENDEKFPRVVTVFKYLKKLINKRG